MSDFEDMQGSPLGTIVFCVVILAALAYGCCAGRNVPAGGVYRDRDGNRHRAANAIERDGNGYFYEVERDGTKTLMVGE